MLWLKAFHVVFVVTWFAGLFYLPRLFIYHAAATDRVGIERFVTMEKRLFRDHEHRRGLCRDFWRRHDHGRPCLLERTVAANQSSSASRSSSAIICGATVSSWRCVHGTTAAQRAGCAGSTKCRAVLLLAIVILAVVKPRLY